MAAKKYYAVRKGRIPGIYDTWEACKEQVHGYAAAEYKSFPALTEAKRYLDGRQKTVCAATSEYQIYVDGSFCKKTKRYSWAFVVMKGGEAVHTANGVGDNPAAAAMHNVAGELAAAMQAIKWAVKQNIQPIVIYHDYQGIGAWATGAWQAKNEFTKAYAEFVTPYRDWIFFEKVTGHTGVVGNELADQLAGEALGRMKSSK